MDRLTKNEKIEACVEAAELLRNALELLEPIAMEDANFDAYVYRQIKEHYLNENPYNQSVLSYLEKCYDEDDCDEWKIGGILKEG